MAIDAHLAGHVEHSENPHGGVHGKAHRRLPRRLRLHLQHVVQEDHRRAEIGQDVVHALPRLPGQGPAIAHGRRTQERPVQALVEAVDPPVPPLVRVVDAAGRIGSGHHRAAMGQGGRLLAARGGRGGQGGVRHRRVGQEHADGDRHVRPGGPGEADHQPGDGQQRRSMAAAGPCRGGDGVWAHGGGYPNKTRRGTRTRDAFPSPAN